MHCNHDGGLSSLMVVALRERLPTRWLVWGTLALMRAVFWDAVPEEGGGRTVVLSSSTVDEVTEKSE